MFTDSNKRYVPWQRSSWPLPHFQPPHAHEHPGSGWCSWPAFWEEMIPLGSCPFPPTERRTGVLEWNKACTLCEIHTLKQLYNTSTQASAHFKTHDHLTRTLTRTLTRPHLCFRFLPLAPSMFRADIKTLFITFKALHCCAACYDSDL